MTLFWAIAALLVCLALAFLVTPLVRNRAASGGSATRAAANLAVFRDQLVELDADLAAGSIGHEQWEAARGDLQRGLLEAVDVPSASAAAPVIRSKATAIVVALAVPLIAVPLYLELGNRQGLEPGKVSAAAQGAPHELTPEQINAMVARLAQKLASNPDDGEGWVMLARTYNALGRFDEAVAAYAKAEAKFPQNSALLADYADSLAMAQGQTLKGKPEALIQRALQIDGNNLKALALAGTAEFENNNFAKAIEYWGRMLPLLAADSEMGNSVRASIQEAQAKQGGMPKSSTQIAQNKQEGEGAPKASPASDAAKAKGVSGTVKLAPALAARAAPEDTVFVLARPAQGGRMPLAAVRVKVKDLPLVFSFDDSMAMNPSAKISDFAEVVVAARVSKSGNVVPQRGDLEGVSKPLRPGTAGIVVQIANEIQ
jgi:cytochrome c-type biogenesis protein CcmH